MLARAGVLFTIVFALTLNGLSHLFEGTNPKLALRLNPFNMEARVAAFVDLLGDGPLVRDADRRIAENAVRFSPGDARAYSMMGEMAKRDGDAAAASRWFARALRHSKTEIRALLNQLQEALTAGDMAGAVRYFDLTMRRWPGYRDAVEPVLPSIISSEGGATAFREALAQDPPWRARAVERLLSTASGAAFVESYLLDEIGSKSRSARSDINATITAMVRLRAPRRAYQFFLSTLSPSEGQRVGYVFNSRFLPNPEPGYFAWRIKQASGAETTSGDGLRVRFLDSPTRLGNVSQVLSLPPGRFDLTSRTTATRLTAPKKLVWEVACADQRSPLAVLEVPGGSYGSRPLEATFAVPIEGCPLQTLTLRTGLTVDSWRYRFGGEVLFESVAIARSD